MPTRLLDWSASVLAAAFFAVEKAGKAEGLIYALRSVDEIDEHREGSDEKQLFGRQSVKLYRPPQSRPVDFSIPAELAEDEVLGYLDDLFHERAIAEDPRVRRI